MLRTRPVVHDLRRDLASSTGRMAGRFEGIAVEVGASPSDGRALVRRPNLTFRESLAINPPAVVSSTAVVTSHDSIDNLRLAAALDPSRGRPQHSESVWSHLRRTIPRRNSDLPQNLRFHCIREGIATPCEVQARCTKQRRIVA